MSAGGGAFETIGASAGALPLWERHLARLERTARFLELPWAPPDDLLEQARARLMADHQTDGILRLALGQDGRFEFVTRPRRTHEGPLRLHPVHVERTETDALARFKCADRSFYAGPLAEAVAASADDALLIDASGRLLETTTCNVFVEFDAERLVTPPLDAPILPGVARALLCERLARAGRAALEEPIGVRDLSRATAIWITNAVYGPRQATLPGQPAFPAPNWLGELWAQALRDASSTR